MKEKAEKAEGKKTDKEENVKRIRIDENEEIYLKEEILKLAQRLSLVDPLQLAIP